MQAEILDQVAKMVLDRRTSTQQERDLADWHLCDYVRKNLGSYMPVYYPTPELQVAAVLKLGPEAGRAALDADEECAKAFSKYRFALTEHEAQEAQKLYMLASTVQTLMRIRPRSNPPAIVDEALAQIATWIAERWRTDVPLRGDMRTWSRRITERTDLMAAEWRRA